VRERSKGENVGIEIDDLVVFGFESEDVKFRQGGVKVGSA